MPEAKSETKPKRRNPVRSKKKAPAVSVEGHVDQAIEDMKEVTGLDVQETLTVTPPPATSMEALQTGDPRYEAIKSEAQRTLDNASIADAQEKVSDIKVIGNGDAWQLLCKASSYKEGWMKSTKAMEVPSGCLVQVTTREFGEEGQVAVAEAVTFVPGMCVVEDVNGGRRLADHLERDRLKKQKGETS